MVMEASPTSSLEVPEPELLFQFLVVPLDAPAQLRELDEAVEGGVFRNGRQPELRGPLLFSWPFDEEPFLVTGNASIEVPVRGANTDAREARDHPGLDRLLAVIEGSVSSKALARTFASDQG